MNQEIGMDKKYTVCNHIFTSKEIMSLCKSLSIVRMVEILALTSKHYGRNLDVVKTDFYGSWYQVSFLSNGRSRRYTFPNNKIQISQQTLLNFEHALVTNPKPKDYINKEFKEEDIIFCREFFRVKKVFGDFMIVENINYQRIRTLTKKQCSDYLIIDDPIIHLHI